MGRKRLCSGFLEHWIALESGYVDCNSGLVGGQQVVMFVKSSHQAPVLGIF